MDVHLRSAPRRATGVALALLAAAPLPARALPLLERDLALGSAGAAPSLAVVLAAEPRGPSLDFDLLEPPKAVTQVEDGRMRWRRRLLKTHQGVGLGLIALQLATTVVGQLNYSDKYNGGQTGRYEASHTVLAYSTLGVFARERHPRAAGAAPEGEDEPGVRPGVAAQARHGHRHGRDDRPGGARHLHRQPRGIPQSGEVREVRTSP